jgi:hypothetical protein
MTWSPSIAGDEAISPRWRRAQRSSPLSPSIA